MPIMQSLAPGHRPQPRHPVQRVTEAGNRLEARLPDGGKRDVRHLGLLAAHQARQHLTNLSGEDLCQCQGINAMWCLLP